MKEDKLMLYGTVEEVLPGGKYKVQVKEGNAGKDIICYLSGKMILNKINVICGDKVEVEASIYDLNKGRIVKLLKNKQQQEAMAKS